MLLIVDRHNGIPAYRQLMDQIRFQVASGVLAAGAELPSTRALSAELGLNPMTISKAYAYLEREGLLERRPGRPLVVRELAIENEQPQLDELRRALAPLVTIVRQLGVDNERAQELFGELLAEAREDDRVAGDNS
jgi:DNA-binding transcriptional regulator YhcF (GntR family)